MIATSLLFHISARQGPGPGCGHRHWHAQTHVQTHAQMHARLEHMRALGSPRDLADAEL